MADDKGGCSSPLSPPPPPPATPLHGMFCNFTKGIGYVYRNDTTWVDAINENSVILQRRCPFDYCLTQLIGVDLRYPDTQCAMNHAGTLCGGCKKGFSLALGTNISGVSSMELRVLEHPPQLRFRNAINLITAIVPKPVAIS